MERPQAFGSRPQPTNMRALGDAKCNSSSVRQRPRFQRGRWHRRVRGGPRTTRSMPCARRKLPAVHRYGHHESRITQGIFRGALTPNANTPGFLGDTDFGSGHLSSIFPPGHPRIRRLRFSNYVRAKCEAPLAPFSFNRDSGARKVPCPLRYPAGRLVSVPRCRRYVISATGC